MRCDELMNETPSGEPLMALDWSALGTLVRARAAMSVSETLLATSQLGGVGSDSSASVRVSAIERGCESL